MSLIERKEILKKLLERQTFSLLKFSEHIEGKGKAFFKFALKNRLEGLVAKRKDSVYQFKRSPDWLKIKTRLRQEVVIGGFTLPKGSRKYFGALIVGVYEKGKLTHVGHVGGGFNHQLLKEMYEKLKENCDL